MTEFGIELLNVFGNLNRSVTIAELSRQFSNQSQLKNGISELESEGYIKEKSLMNYCITSYGRNHLRLAARNPINHPNAADKAPVIKRAAKSLWLFINANIIASILGGLIVAFIIYLITKYC